MRAFFIGIAMFFSPQKMRKILTNALVLKSDFEAQMSDFVETIQGFVEKKPWIFFTRRRKVFTKP